MKGAAGHQASRPRGVRMQWREELVYNDVCSRPSGVSVLDCSNGWRRPPDLWRNFVGRQRLLQQVNFSNCTGEIDVLDNDFPVDNYNTGVFMQLSKHLVLCFTAAVEYYWLIADYFTKNFNLYNSLANIPVINTNKWYLFR